MSALPNIPGAGPDLKVHKPGRSVGYRFLPSPRRARDLMAAGKLKPLDVVVLDALLDERTEFGNSCWATEGHIGAVVNTRSRETIRASYRRLEALGLARWDDCPIPDPDERRNRTGHRICFPWLDSEGRERVGAHGGNSANPMHVDGGNSAKAMLGVGGKTYMHMAEIPPQLKTPGEKEYVDDDDRARDGEESPEGTGGAPDAGTTPDPSTVKASPPPPDSVCRADRDPGSYTPHGEAGASGGDIHAVEVPPDVLEAITASMGSGWADEASRSAAQLRRAAAGRWDLVAMAAKKIGRRVRDGKAISPFGLLVRTVEKLAAAPPVAIKTPMPKPATPSWPSESALRGEGGLQLWLKKRLDAITASGRSVDEGAIGELKQTIRDACESHGMKPTQVDAALDEVDSAIESLKKRQRAAGAGKGPGGDRPRPRPIPAEPAGDDDDIDIEDM